ncbi:g3245 [Coccomyxa elongata]
MPAAPLPEAASDPEDPPPDELALLLSERASLAGVQDAALARAPAFQRPTNARPKEICGCGHVRWRSTPEKRIAANSDQQGSGRLNQA